MKYFDAQACIGDEIVNHQVKNHEGFIVLEKVDVAKDAKELIMHMDYVGIEKALVWHVAMYEADPTSGNKILLDTIAGYENRLIPSWTILPSITDKEYSPEVFFEQMKIHRIKALRAFPEINRYLLNRITMKEQLDIITELKIPLYVEARDNYDAVYSLLEEFPKLTLILCNIGCWPSARYIYPLLKTYPNFYFETGDFGMVNGFEEICQYFGSERLLFGTNFPTNNPACSMYMLMKAKIPTRDKENIAYYNLQRLIEEVKL